MPGSSAITLVATLDDGSRVNGQVLLEDKEDEMFVLSSAVG